MKNEIFENAVYQSPTEVLFIGNPLIEAIPSIGDPLEYAAQLMVIMPYQESDRNLNRMERLNKLPYIKQLHVPCTCDTEIAMNVDRCLRWGYFGRNPMPLSVIQQAITENGIPFDDRLRRVFRSYKQPAYGFPVFGISGVGKTCSVMNVLTLYPQVIVHTNYRGVPFDLHQLVWLKVDCPQDGSTKGLCQRILQEMDRILGSHFSEQHSFNRISKEVLLGDLRSAIDSCSLGILVIDDVQNLCSVRDQVSTELLNFLVSLVNTAEVPIVMVGAPKFTTILQSEFQQAKRVTGEGEVHMDLLKQGSKEWNRYIRALWHYQYTRKKVELTAALSDAFYEETVGNQFLLAILYKLVQDYAIISKTETFDAETVHRTADLRLGLTKQQRKDMREGRDVDLTLYEHLWRAPAIPKEMNPQEQMPKDDPLQSLISNLVTVFGVSMQDSRKAARSVAAAFPDEKDPAKLLLYAAELLDKSGIGKDSARDPTMIREDQEHLLVFPIPMKGECWYSLLARYHAISGNSSEKYTFDQLFGGKTVLDAAVTLPARVKLIDAWLPRECGLTSDRIIREFTAYQYLRLSSRFPDTAYQRLMQGSAKRGRGMRSQMAGALRGRHQKLCFCPDCVRSDTEEYHHSCWHLVHQINGVRYCPVHGMRLIESPWLKGEKLVHFYPAPNAEMAGQMERESRGEETDVFQDRFFELAKTIDWLLANSERIGTEERLLQFYESELGTAPSWQDILRHLASKDAGFVLELFPEEDLVRMGNDVIKHGLRQQSPLFHALMIMRFGGVQWLERKTQT